MFGRFYRFQHFDLSIPADGWVGAHGVMPWCGGMV